MSRHTPLILVLLLTLLLCPQRAEAHAALLEASPPDGAVLPAPPREVVLRFNEAVSPLVLTLIAADGASTMLERPPAAGETIRIALPGTIGDGSHLISWRVVSADGHPVGGTVVFSVGAPSAVPLASAPDPAVRALLWIARVAVYAGLFVGIGGVFFERWVARPPVWYRRLPYATLATGFAAALLSVGLQGVDALGVPVAALSQRAVWLAGAGTSAGPAALLAALAFLLAAAAAAAPRSGPARALSLAALAGCGAALAASGHAASAPPSWLARPAVFLHAVAVACWLGALLPLAGLLRVGDPLAAVALARFARTIPYAVAVLAAAGVALLALQVPDPALLPDTGYGRVLLVKLALVAAMLGIAAVNRWQLTGPAVAGEAPSVRRLVRMILLECAIAACILGTVALWRFTPPPRVLSVPVVIAQAHMHEARAMADLTLTRDLTGLATASVVVMTGDFGPLDPKEMTLVLAHPGAGVEGIRRPVRRVGDGTWRVTGLALPVAGRWRGRIDILVSDFELVTLETDIDVAP